MVLYLGNLVECYAFPAEPEVMSFDMCSDARSGVADYSDIIQSRSHANIRWGHAPAAAGAYLEKIRKPLLRKYPADASRTPATSNVHCNPPQTASEVRDACFGNEVVVQRLQERRPSNSPPARLGSRSTLARSLGLDWAVLATGKMTVIQIDRSMVWFMSGRMRGNLGPGRSCACLGSREDDESPAIFGPNIDTPQVAEEPEF
ncbi:hypothetical protein QBC40DRAFT_349443 [Triangularia verruculosa]|uniref:Uncharacterized protein n=1 Tax=Triangularia verruculosa TaxID=2587418 RepID=A0AAN7ASE7_9PEZI|nr:hypothetical protein QBC40DRAFT_349443 [Triangularia verruculosa]